MFVKDKAAVYARESSGEHTVTERQQQDQGGNIVIFLPEFSEEATRSALQRLQSHVGVQGVLMLVAADNAPYRPWLDPLLRSSALPIYGGVFPSLLWQGEKYDRGVILVAHCCSLQVIVVPKVDQATAALEQCSRQRGCQDWNSMHTLFAFVDSCCGHVGALMNALFNQFGLELNYLGAGCGTLAMQSGPVVITPAGLLTGGAVLGLAGCHSSVGVAHGWLPISTAFKVTGGGDQSITSLDWQPAMQVYRHAIEAHTGQPVAPGALPATTRAYPFGIAKLSEEMVVRDPLRLDESEIHCVGPIATGSYVHVLHGDRESLVQAVVRARQEAHDAVQAGHEPRHMMFVDCVSRALFLEAHFEDELRAVSEKNLPMFGALTLGEIANSGQDYLEFLNKTAVVGLL